MISVTPKSQINSTSLTLNKSTLNLNMKSNDNKQITKIVMSKEWVLPPRPKPGRKPCDDIPNSKRKAQNRAAQRAFRERRANRVSELEEQIMGMERDRSIQEGILNNLIKTLKNENNQLKLENETLKTKNYELLLKLNLNLDENTDNKSSDNGDNGDNNNNNNNNNNNVTHTIKSKITLLESLLNFESQRAIPLKRKKNNSPEREIDFTNAFSFKKQRKIPILNASSHNDITKNKEKKRSPHIINNDSSLLSISTVDNNILSTSTSTSPSPSQYLSSISFVKKTSEINTNTKLNPMNINIPFESCGFCSDDTPCVCKEIADEEEKDIKDAKLKTEIEKKELELILELTKSANDEDISQVIKCNGDPGTCLQCRNDPLSTLFCKTVADKSNKQEKIKTANFNEFKLPNFNSIINASSSSPLGDYKLPSLESLNFGVYNDGKKQFVPCADAYKTISNHLDVRNIGINNITNNLQTKGMFVEVGSVVSCLRELDRNFSKSK
jgi:hypothetical protein